MEKKDIATCQVVIPDDVIEEEILWRLPEKSLARFKSVSKQWRSVIVRFSTPKLLVLGTEVSSDYRSRTLFLETISKHEDDDHDDNHKNKFFIHSYQFPDPDYYYFRYKVGRIMGYCDGLVCIYDLGYIFIVNPTTRNFRILSPTLLQQYTTRPGWTGELPINVGFGRDIVTGTYKLILMYLFDGFLVKAEVFDLNNDVRRNIRFPILYNELIEDKTSIFANGSLFWLTKRNKKFQKLAAIDLHTEKFRDVLLPSWYTEYSKSIYLWSVKDEKLCLSDALQYPIVDVWSLREEAPSVKWEKIFSIDISDMDCLDPSFWKLGLAAYNLRPRGLKPSKSNLLKNVPEENCRTVVYSENLVSPV